MKEILEVIALIACLVFVYFMTKEPKHPKPKLPYNDSRFKSSSECRFWGHQWTKWRNSFRGNMNYQIRECEKCGKIEQRINPYTDAI